jgi:hypothetical protein
MEHAKANDVIISCNGTRTGAVDDLQKACAGRGYEAVVGGRIRPVA